MERVSSVSELKLDLLESNPPELVIAAVGEVLTTGWIDPQLVAWSYDRPPIDGIYDFDFVAEAPAGTVTGAFEPIVAILLTRESLDHLIGVRVHASNNHIVRRIAEEWEPCRASYRAAQIPGSVVLFAEGWHGSAGYEARLKKVTMLIDLPEWELVHKSPAGIPPRVITPFSAIATFAATDPVGAVVVSDGAGRHEIPVQQVPDVMGRTCG